MMSTSVNVHRVKTVSEFRVHHEKPNFWISIIVEDDERQQHEITWFFRSVEDLRRVLINLHANIENVLTATEPAPKPEFEDEVPF